MSVPIVPSIVPTYVPVDPELVRYSYVPEDGSPYPMGDEGEMRRVEGTPYRCYLAPGVDSSTLLYGAAVVASLAGVPTMAEVTFVIDDTGRISVDAPYFHTVDSVGRFLFSMISSAGYTFAVEKVRDGVYVVYNDIYCDEDSPGGFGWESADKVRLKLDDATGLPYLAAA